MSNAAIETARVKYETTVGRARDNQDISPIKRQKVIARAFLDVSKTLDGIQNESRTARATRKTELERKVFGIPNPSDASAAISYRDALDRVSALDISDERSEIAATDMLQRAVTSGDELMARAILAVSYDRGWADIINEYGRVAPTIEAELEELWNVRAAGNPSATFYEGLDYYTPVPREVEGLHVSQIEAIAASEVSAE